MKISSLSISALAVLSSLLTSCVPPTTPPTAQSSLSSPVANTAMTGPEHILITEADITWTDAPASIPAGAKVAILEGDPSKPGPFMMRLQFPANYTIAPHFHPADEHVTVMSGTFALGMGETFDETKLEELDEGGFAVMKTGTRHFARTVNGATIQLHGIGPWGLTYVNPEDDPRNRGAVSSQ